MLLLAEKSNVILKIDAHLDYTFDSPIDVLMQIEAAELPGQVIEQADLTINGSAECRRVPSQDDVGERIWFHADGQMLIDYSATVRVDRIASNLAALAADPLYRLPGPAVPYLMPSRYCPSNLFGDFVGKTFGKLDGGAKIAAMRDWIAGHLSYVPGASDGDTTAHDTFHDREGICRDYAHLMITLARAADIPARFASVYGLGVTPQDFHAVAEVYLGGAWHLVDATDMGTPEDMAIIGIGRDSGDVAFLTAFGPLRMNSQTVSVTEVAETPATA